MLLKKKQLKQIIGLVVSLWLHSFLAAAQHEADNWYFGNKASLEFPNSGEPVSFLNSAMMAVEGCASISDKNGQLLFYTNGLTVWNRFHQVMANGTDLNGFNSSTQGTLIVPKPGSTTLYYIFTNAANDLLNPGLFYSIVDISKDSVLANSKNTQIYGSAITRLTEKLTAVNHFNNRDIWLITSSFHFVPGPGIEMAAFKITPAGIVNTPVVSPLAVPYPNPANIPYYFLGNQLKASPNGKQLASAFNNDFYLFDFNNKAGTVSNPQLLATISGARPFMYGTEFSPDSRLLYCTDSASIKQYDLAAGNTAAIVASSVTLPIPNVFSFQNYAMQLGPNRKIYAIANNLVYVINKPNLKGAACSLTSGPTLPLTTYAIAGLPNFIQSYFAPPKFEYSGSCTGSPITFTIPSQTNIDSVNWNFGDSFSGVANTSHVLQPDHYFSFSGTYDVSLTIFTEGDTVFATRPVTIRSQPLVDIGGDQELCEGDQITLRNFWPPGPFNEKYLWSDSTSGGTLLVRSPGTYWLQLTVGDCVVRDSVVITYKPRPKVELGGSRSVCGNAPVTLDATFSKDPRVKYYWLPTKDTTATITVTQSGIYTVKLDLNGCTATDSTRVTFVPDLDFTLGEDIVVCEGETVLLQAPLPSPPPAYLWSDGSTNKYIIKATKSGKYWVRLTRGTCVVSDTINVLFKPCPPPPVPYIPNIVTPNADNYNDKLEITGIPAGAWNLKIYNRWGQLLYQKKGYQNDWPENKIPDGTYYYYLEDPDTGRTWKGWFQAVR